MYSKKIRNGITDVLRWTAIMIVCLLSVVPVLFIIVSSFKIPREIFQIPPKLMFQPTLDNYIGMFTYEPEFVRSMINSLVITISGIAVMVTVCSLAGYAYSRYRFKIRKQSAFALIALRLLPPIIITIPLYPFLKLLNMLDSVITVMLLYVTMEVSLGIWLMKSFIDNVPVELEEAAKIDGATTLQTFLRITMPNAYPGLMATAIFFAVFSWNEFTFAFIFTHTKAVTAPIIISRLLNAELGLQWGILFGCTTIQMVPIIVFFWMVQKYLVRGMTFGALKG